MASSLLIVFVLPIAAFAAPTFEGAAMPVVQKHCASCHGEKKQKAGVDFSGIKDSTTAMKRYDLWAKAVEQVRKGEMPPDDEPPLTAAEKDALLGWFDDVFDARKHPDPGPPLTRQFTRDEYENTMRDLLRINFSPAGAAGIRGEDVVEGFANRAGGLVMDPSLMEKYFLAADLALEFLFTDKGGEGPKKNLLAPGLMKDLAPKDGVRKVLAPFVRRAFRRTVPDAELEPFASIADAALAAGEPFDAAIRKAMKPVLVSPRFLLRVEANQGKPGAVARISDCELATRLSYFLSATMPDDELFAAAENGKLSDSAELEKQVRRLLMHPYKDSMTRYFFERWLQLPSIGKSLPSQNNFPTFTRSLRDSMENEMRQFCNNLRKEDRSILELLDADYTFANAELARHYKLAEVPPKDFVKVNLRPQDHRGGLLGMAAMLTMTSHTDRTKPTARGKWILDVMLGTPPPPPPPNAGSFAPQPKDKPEPKNFREKLDQHAADPNCLSCHKRIDPLGFALENYDAIGAWRDDIGGAAVDNAGKLPGGAEFRGVDGLRKVLREKQPRFVRNFCAQLLSFALGREVTYYDEPALDEMVGALETNEFRLSAAVIAAVRSYPFQHRKTP